MNTEIFVVLLCFMKILAQRSRFFIDQKCVYNEAGNFAIFTPQLISIKFYIPWKFTDASNPADSTLFVSSESLNFSIPHPLSSSYQSIIPKEYLKIGWNELNIFGLQLYFISEVRLVIKGFYKVIEIRTNDLDGYKFWITGLHSFVNCREELKSFWISPKTVPTFPFVMNADSGYFFFESDNQSSTAELKFREGLHICKTEDRRYTVSKSLECSGDRVKIIQEKGLAAVTMHNKHSFDDKDIFNYKGTYFTEVTFENVGEKGFYIQISINNYKSAPLSSLQVNISQNQGSTSGNFKIRIFIAVCTILIIGLIAGLIYCCLRFKKTEWNASI